MSLVSEDEALPRRHGGQGQGDKRRARDQKVATEMVRKSGQMGVPVTKIGESWIVGFNRSAID